MNQVFHLVHANVYCYWGQKQIYIPCEVSISKFSLKEGVISTYHVFPAPCTDNGQLQVNNFSTNCKYERLMLFVLFIYVFCLS